MAELHTEDNFMYHNCRDAEQASWENQLLDDYDTVSRDYRDSHLDKTAQTDPLVYRITHQRGPKVPSTESLFSQKNKVDWDQAPHWAAYWAMDANGSAYWYSFKPEIDMIDSEWITCDAVDAAPSFRFPANLWVNSLTERPLYQTNEEEGALEELVEQSEKIDLYDNEVVHDLTKPLSQQIGGDHYRQGSIQPIEYIHANNMDFFSGNVVKYITRWKYKNGLEDLKKAKHYIELLMEQEYGYHG